MSAGPCVRVTRWGGEDGNTTLCGSPETTHQFIGVEIGGELQHYMVPLCQFHVTIATFHQEDLVAPDD